jgi:hypothetical protein
MNAYERHQAEREALCNELLFYTVAEMAERRGITYDAMRQRMSYYGACCLAEQHQERRSLVRKLWHRGEPSTIASYLNISPDALRVLSRRMGLGNGQTAIHFP